ncbi:MAG: serine/threonine-protein kinase [Anaerolineales bacterium]
MASLVGKSLSSYELIELAGQGGMAAVYRGFDRVRKMWVAVKVLAPALAEDRTFVRRFEREARILSDLKHPNIVPILEFGQAEGYLFLVMPFYQEGSLARRMRQGPVLPLDGARIIESVSGALDHAHQMGVVHRDVKPSNVLLEGEAAHLADFGLAQIGDASVSLTGSALLGTPAYVSPEAVSGGEVGPPSDQYSLGVLIFELTVGKLPFEGDTPMAAIVKVLNDPFPRPRDINPKIPEAIERVILKATARNPAERFSSVGEMNRAFQAGLQYALNPRLPAPPVVEVPSSARLPRPAQGLTQPLPKPAPRRKRRSWALLVPLLVALAFACPLGASSMIELLRPLTNPAESSGLPPAGIPDSQITAAAATIQALSTEVAASHAELAGPDAINTAVALTMEVLNPSATSEGPPATETALVEETATGSGTGAIVASQTPTRTPTRTPTPSRTPTRTPTRTATPAVSATFGPSPTASNTPVASSSPVPSASPSAAASTTSTSLPASPTSAPSATTAPTGTPSGPDCGDYSLSNWVPLLSRMRVNVSNGGSTVVKIVVIDLDWPDSNGDFDEVNLRGNTIWDDGDNNPPTYINSNWTGNRYIGPGNNDTLEFDFSDPAALTGYTLEVTFDNGCSASGSK